MIEFPHPPHGEPLGSGTDAPGDLTGGSDERCQRVGDLPRAADIATLHDIANGVFHDPDTAGNPAHTLRADTSLSSAPPSLPGTGAGGSISSVLQERLRQIERGYTPAADAQLSIYEMLSLLSLRMGDAKSAWPFVRKQDRNPGKLRHFLVKLAATALALIDRLDGEGRSQEPDSD